MSHREGTVQQLDPLGALSSRPLTFVASTCVLAYGIAITMINAPDIDHPVIAALALVVAVAASLVVVVASGPRYAFVKRKAFILAVGLAFAGYLLSIISMWNRNAHLRGDWGPMVVGIVILSFLVYRPPRELAIAGILSAIFTGFMVLADTRSLVTEIPTIVLIITAATPVLTLSLGAAALAQVVIRSIRRWGLEVIAAAKAMETELHAGIARSVQQDRVTILNRDVVPFLTHVLQSGDIGDEDRARALAISESIRSVMVAEVDRSWLDSVIESEGMARLGKRAPGAETVHDPDRLAAAMTTDQRTAMRALIVALFSHDAFDRQGLDIRLDRRAVLCVVSVRASFRASESVIRQYLAAYLAILRIVFIDFELTWSRNTLTVRFFYDEH